jgi:hypothetical protein
MGLSRSLVSPLSGLWPSSLPWPFFPFATSPSLPDQEHWGHPLSPCLLFRHSQSLSAGSGALSGGKAPGGGLVGHYVAALAKGVSQRLRRLCAPLRGFHHLSDGLHPYLFWLGFFKTAPVVRGPAETGQGVHAEKKERRKRKKKVREEIMEKEKARPRRKVTIIEPKKEPPKKPEQEAFPFMTLVGEFKLPPLDLLNEAPAEQTWRFRRKAWSRTPGALERKLGDFGVEGEVVEILPGPVITMYELKPAPGVKISKVAGLSDDLALALRAPSVRIVAPIPGKGGHRHRNPQQPEEPRLSAGNPLLPDFQILCTAFDDCPRQRHHRCPFCHGPCQNAPPPGGRGNGDRQERVSQQHDHQSSL